MASDTRPQIDIMVGHRRRRHWCRLRCQNLRFGFDENRNTFHPLNRVRANVWQRRIYRFISANSASRNTCRILAHSKWRTLAHSHTHTHVLTIWRLARNHIIPKLVDMERQQIVSMANAIHFILILKFGTQVQHFAPCAHCGINCENVSHLCLSHSLPSPWLSRPSRHL